MLLYSTYRLIRKVFKEREIWSTFVRRSLIESLNVQSFVRIRMSHFELQVVHSDFRLSSE